jgi:hypothetical protein
MPIGKIGPIYLPTILTSSLDELETPKNLEFLQQTDYPRGQVYEALKAFLSQLG